MSKEKKFNEYLKKVHETFWKGHKKVGKVMVYGTAGEPLDNRELEKMFTSPEGYKRKAFDAHKLFPFDMRAIQNRLDEIYCIQNICPYDMTEEDFYNRVQSMDHTPRAGEDEWIKWYEAKRKQEDAIGEFVRESDFISVKSIINEKLLQELYEYNSVSTPVVPSLGDGLAAG